MATINEKLQSIQNSKDAIKAAIIAKGGTCSDKLSEFASAVSGIPGGGGTQWVDIDATIVDVSVYGISTTDPLQGEIIMTELPVPNISYEFDDTSIGISHYHISNYIEDSDAYITVCKGHKLFELTIVVVGNDGGKTYSQTMIATFDKF